MGILQASSTISHLSIASPPGFGPDDFLELAKGSFDLNFLSLFVSPFELQQLAVHDCRIAIDQKHDHDSNAYRIIEHAQKATRRNLLRRHDNETLADELQMLGNKIKVETLQLTDITSKLCIHPICDTSGPVILGIRRVVVQDVGRKGEGVYLYELLEMIVHALLAAALQAAPTQLSAILARGLGSAMQSGKALLDYESLHIDVGEGLIELGSWTDKKVARSEDTPAALSSSVADALRNSSAALGGFFTGLLGNAPGSSVGSASRSARSGVGRSLPQGARLPEGAGGRRGAGSGSSSVGGSGVETQAGTVTGAAEAGTTTSQTSAGFDGGTLENITETVGETIGGFMENATEVLESLARNTSAAAVSGLHQAFGTIFGPALNPQPTERHREAVHDVRS
eukprot:CAMPEP_0179089216 /NCGR_PEP_ID=MMETSP0796-20121207/40637_1 /TAXON_ID=73915 /ORGANISM="Pyrodinium bahamense, Strain pbaha01" /LENGTH=397 /DNA_ID=CAMNT_0020786763 /DNA_START=339 /DNA_END=1532 /DNA_ORIENTATION=-